MTGFRNFPALQSAANAGPPLKTAIVCAAQREVLLATDTAVKRGWIHPILIGDPDAITAEAEDGTFSLTVRAVDPA